jgi:ketosteroid isomerase-like protein
MSKANVKLMRRVLEAVNQGDVDAWIAAWHPEAELYELVGIPDAPQVYRGHSGVREWLANARSILGQDLHMEPRDFTSIGDVVL